HRETDQRCDQQSLEWKPALRHAHTNRTHYKKRGERELRQQQKSAADAKPDGAPPVWSVEPATEKPERERERRGARHVRRGNSGMREDRRQKGENRRADDSSGGADEATRQQSGRRDR